MKRNIRIFLILVGILFVNIGVYRGEVSEVFKKAINICLECIGIGQKYKKKIYSLFNPISLYRFEIDADKCTNCGICSRKCKMQVDVHKTPNRLECIRCGECITSCPQKAIKVLNQVLQNVLLENCLKNKIS